MNGETAGSGLVALRIGKAELAGRWKFSPALAVPYTMEHQVYDFSEIRDAVGVSSKQQCAGQDRRHTASSSGFSGSHGDRKTTKRRCRQLHHQMPAPRRLYRCHGGGALVKCKCIIVRILEQRCEQQHCCNNGSVVCSLLRLPWTDFRSSFTVRTPQPTTKRAADIKR